MITGSASSAGVSAEAKHGSQVPFNHGLFDEALMARCWFDKSINNHPTLTSKGMIASATSDEHASSHRSSQLTLALVDTPVQPTIRVGQKEPAPIAKARAARAERDAISAGARLASPAGRTLLVADVFVPRSNAAKSRTLPARFRHFNRKIVVFANGSIAPLQEIKARYRVLM